MPVYEYPEGTTTLLSPIEYGENTVIRGQGRGVTILDGAGLEYAIRPKGHSSEIEDLHISNLTIANARNGIWLQDTWDAMFHNIEVQGIAGNGLLMDGGQHGVSGLMAVNFFARWCSNGITFGVPNPSGFASINKFIGGGAIGNVNSGIVLATELGGGCGAGIATTYFEAFQIECNNWGARVGDADVCVDRTVFHNCFWDGNYSKDLMNLESAFNTTVIAGLIHMDKVTETKPIIWVGQAV